MLKTSQNCLSFIVTSIRLRENAVDEQVRSIPQLQTNFPLGTLGTKEIARVNDALLVRRERRNDNTRAWLDRGKMLGLPRFLDFYRFDSDNWPRQLHKSK